MATSRSTRADVFTTHAVVESSGLATTRASCCAAGRNHHAWKHAHLTDRGVRRLRCPGLVGHSPRRHPGRSGRARPHRATQAADLARESAHRRSRAQRPTSTSTTYGLTARLRTGTQRRRRARRDRDRPRARSNPGTGRPSTPARSADADDLCRIDRQGTGARPGGGQIPRHSVARTSSPSSNRTAGSAPIAGRIENLNDDFGDANVIGQAYAAHGLAVASSARRRPPPTSCSSSSAQRRLPAGLHR